MTPAKCPPRPAVSKRNARLAKDCRAALLHLLRTLDLRYTEAARMFTVSPTTVRRWALGEAPVSVAASGSILLQDDALRRLTRMISRGRIQSVVRRQSHLLNGGTPLSWILDGRIAEVTARYERVLRYQG